MGNLDRRLRWLECRGGVGPRPTGTGPRIVIITGGLPQPLGAMVAGTDLELAALPGETFAGFHTRAREWAYDLAAEIVVISGQAIEV